MDEETNVRRLIVEYSSLKRTINEREASYRKEIQPLRDRLKLLENDMDALTEYWKNDTRKGRTL
jgi:hypothetical protein